MLSVKNEPGFQIQDANTTSYDRYPREFYIARALARTIRKQQLKILSFGCSTGEETVSLLNVFPDDNIVGLDISPFVIRKARENNSADGKITYDISSAETLQKYGPYDLIFAMSVFCAWPASRDIDNISKIFPFSKFEDFVQKLDEVLNPGGVLVIFNSNFEFLDTDVSKKYEVVISNTTRSTGFVHRFAADNRRVDGYSGNVVVFRKAKAPSLAHNPPSATARVVHFIDPNGSRLGSLSLSRL